MTADSSLTKTPEQTSSHTKRQSADWDIHNAPRNYISLVAAHGTTALFSFLSVWLITRYLGSEGYGGIAAFVAASQLAQIFINWSSTALARFGIEEFIETGRVTRSFWSRTLIFIPNLVLVVLLSAFWLQPVAGWLKIPDSAIWLIIVHLVVTSMWLHVQYALQGVKMLRLQGAMLAAERMMTFVGLLLVISFGQLTLRNALWCYIGPALALTAAGFYVLREFIELNGFFTRQHFRRMLVYSFPLIPFAIVGYLSTSQLDAFFITRYLTIHDLGIYAVASQINGMVLQLPILANSILLSMFVSLKASGKDAVISKFLNDIVPSAALAWGVICATGAIVAAVFIPVVFGIDFQAAVGPLAILIMASVVSCLSVFGYATYSHSISATYISTIASILAAVVNVTFNLLLIPK
ncbi:MAG TPA: oligosaccharide flippase family protein, partial [Pyrinomonadaceae bacterium]|nr:oligosaccharide flippase family protein [Pyrinomonadaceae bacterium]